jgi:1-aminocyclopropane-1-carboxylate deaminase
MTHKTPLQKLEHLLFKEKEVNVFVKRDDLIHPYISGNKWRKGQPVIKHMKEKGIKTALTFGGAYSNHIYSFSYACREAGIECIGIIRGDELASKPLNDTLAFAESQGMQLVFVSREEYKQRNDYFYLKDLEREHAAFIVPEGGTTVLAKQGFCEMVDEINEEVAFDYILSASGTGGTISGICSQLKSHQKAVSVPVLKGIESDLESMINFFSSHSNYDIISDYSFGGYGKYNETLLDFINWFDNTYFDIEQVYTGKAFYALFDLIKKDYFKKNSNIVILHTGGLQGKIKKNT